MPDLTSLPEDIRSKLDEAVRVIVEHAHPQLVILFGSYAEGRQREDSDVDLLVVAETEDWIVLADELRTRLRSVLGRLELDLLVRTPQWWAKGRRVRGFVERDADQKGERL